MQANYRNYNRSPQQARRGPGPMVAPPQQAHAQPPQLTQAQIQQQHLEAIRRQDLARRQARKPTDREIPDEVSEAVVGDGVERYKKLRDAEKRLDAIMMRKRLDISDNLQRRWTRREGTLRVWISNTAEGQPWQVVEEGNANEDGMFELGENQATFKVKIEGRLKEDPDEDEADKAPAGHRPRLSTFFKAITIDFDRNPNLQPDGYSQIEWRKKQVAPGQQLDPSDSENSFDQLEFTRKADENINITINLTRDEKSERYKLSPELAEILDTDEEDRAGAVQGIWEYCRAMGLQEDDDKRKIICDAALQKIFKQETVYFPYVPDLLLHHMHPLPPIQLKYTIRVDKSYITGTKDPNSPSAFLQDDGEEPKVNLKPCQPTAYDIRVPLPNPLGHQLTRFHTSKTHLHDLQSIVKIDDDLALLVQKVHQTNAKRKFYNNLSKDPTSFVKRWISSQQRDLEVILAEATRGGGEDATNEEFRRGGKDGVWGSELARESVGLWLARNQKAS
ncbi:Putative SWIB/MDM2 domain-containing protein [Septoria linicola]|uniref:SWIB/MDM2 domain-containing protein n=1 Tax=Septoria linicola TaxID=215465 RepID=A0A9Q9EL77_9PEZI|nr:putative SWIB/MDM2 domain-containing protein [Septoria linicola]USW53148.1 Putative SWIB/MDM2 domain-containing protein [Septoria linicola]